MVISFTKMHCLGNDFVVINGITQKIKLSVKQIKRIADRYTGIGCDQLILLEPPLEPMSDFYYKIYNSDGSMAEQCINGGRCAAKFALITYLANKNKMKADCSAGDINFIIENDGSVTALLKRLKPEINQFLLDFSEFNMPNLAISQEVYHLSIGNPHAIIFLQPQIAQQNLLLEQYHYNLIAKKIADLPIFNKGINIGFASMSDQNIKLKVFERGVGETLSCGSNAIAAYLVAKHLQLVDNKSLVLFKLGELLIKSQNDNITINSMVNAVFNGKFVI